MKNLRNKIIALVLLFFVYGLSGCGMLYMLNFSNLLIGGGNSAVETVSENETDLLSDGPIDLPVTIAKHDSLDADKLDVSEITGGLNVVKSNGQNLTNRVLRITGEALAVRDVEETPFVVGYSYDPGDGTVAGETLIDVNADGSFEIDVTTDEDVILASMDDLGYASPFVQVTKDSETGFFSIITTNSSGLVANQQISADSDDYYYLTFTDRNGTNNLIRRNIDGSEMQEIITGIDYAPEALVSPSGNRTAFSYESADGVGTIVLDLISVTANLKTKMLTTDASPLFDTVTSYEYDLATISDYDFSDNQFKLIFTADEQGVIVVNRVDVSLTFINTISSNSSVLIEAGEFDDLYVAYDAVGDDLYAWISEDGFYTLYLMPLGDDPELAWQNREALIEFEEFEAIVGFDAANGVVTYVQNTDSTYAAFYWNETDGEQSIVSSTTVYANTKITPDGATVFACKTTSPSQLVYHTIGETSGFASLTADSGFATCGDGEGSFAVTDNFVHYYRSEADGDLPQHAMLPLDQF